MDQSYNSYSTGCQGFMAKAMRDKFIAIISLVALRGQIMTVKAHPGLCMKYSRWVIFRFIEYYLHFSKAATGINSRRGVSLMWKALK